MKFPGDLLKLHHLVGIQNTRNVLTDPTEIRDYSENRIARSTNQHESENQVQRFRRIFRRKYSESASPSQQLHPVNIH